MNKCVLSKLKHNPRHFPGDAITAASCRPAYGTRLEGQRALEKIDRLEKGTVSHLSFVFPIRGPQCCYVPLENIIKHERLPSLWAFMASVSISTVFTAERVAL